MTRLRQLLVMTIAAVAAASPTLAQTPQVAESNSPFEISIDPTSVENLDDLANLAIWFENVGSSNATLIRPADGSVDGMRYPIYEWQVIGPDGAPLSSQPRPRCGMVNPLMADDFVELAAGGSIALSDGWLTGPAAFYSFDQPGTYRIRLRYATTGDDPMWSGSIESHNPWARTQWESVWQGSALSNEITVDVDAETALQQAQQSRWSVIGPAPVMSPAPAETRAPTVLTGELRRLQ